MRPQHDGSSSGFLESVPLDLSEDAGYLMSALEHHHWARCFLRSGFVWLGRELGGEMAKVDHQMRSLGLCVEVRRSAIRKTVHRSVRHRKDNGEGGRRSGYDARR